MSDLNDIVRHMFGRFGRPSAESEPRATDEHVAGIDTRLGTVETRQIEIAARLRILEKQGNPLGFGREDGE